MFWAFVTLLDVATWILLNFHIFINLPHKPYCTDELGYTFINPKLIAIQKRYLQHNPPCMVVYLVFDKTLWCCYGVVWRRYQLQHVGQLKILPMVMLILAMNWKHQYQRQEQQNRKLLSTVSAKIEAGMAGPCSISVIAVYWLKNPCHIHWRTTIWTDEKIKWTT